MKTLVLGAGSMGCLFAGRLSQIGEDVTLFNRKNAHVTKIQTHGLRILNNDGTISIIPIPTFSDPANLAQRYDLVIVLVKAHATEAVLTNVLHTIDEYTAVLSLQNGIGNLEKLERMVPYSNIGIGGAGCGAGVIENGLIGHRGNGQSFIGSPKSNSNNRWKEIADMFTRSGLPTEVTENVQSIIWSKLMINIAFNGLTAVTRLTNGDAIFPKEGKEIMKELVDEAANVAHAEGISLLYEDPYAECIRMGKEDIGENKSSMLSDIINKRKTEIDVINGAIVELGKRHAIPTPYNDIMTNLIKIIENNYAKIVTSV